MLVQEVRDPDLSAVSALMEQINRCGGRARALWPRGQAPCLSPGPGSSLCSVSKHEYSFVSSEPLGRDQYKEMYLFVYRCASGLQGGDVWGRGGRLSGPDRRFSTPRKAAVSVVDTYQYPDPEDAFSREPFVVKFSAPDTGEASPAPSLPAPGPSRPVTPHLLPQLPRSWC